LLTRRTLRSAVLVVVAVAAAFAFGMVDVAAQSIHFDLALATRLGYEPYATHLAVRFAEDAGG
jgi:hypothetical protein